MEAWSDLATTAQELLQELKEAPTGDPAAAASIANKSFEFRRRAYEAHAKYGTELGASEEALRRHVLAAGAALVALNAALAPTLAPAIGSGQQPTSQAQDAARHLLEAGCDVAAGCSTVYKACRLSAPEALALCNGTTQLVLGSGRWVLAAAGVDMDALGRQVIALQAAFHLAGTLHVLPDYAAQSAQPKPVVAWLAAAGTLLERHFRRNARSNQATGSMDCLLMLPPLLVVLYEVCTRKAMHECSALLAQDQQVCRRLASVLLSAVRPLAAAMQLPPERRPQQAGWGTAMRLAGCLASDTLRPEAQHRLAAADADSFGSLLLATAQLAASAPVEAQGHDSWHLKLHCCCSALLGIMCQEQYVRFALQNLHRNRRHARQLLRCSLCLQAVLAAVPVQRQKQQRQQGQRDQRQGGHQHQQQQQQQPEMSRANAADVASLASGWVHIAAALTQVARPAGTSPTAAAAAFSSPTDLVLWCNAAAAGLRALPLLAQAEERLQGAGVPGVSVEAPARLARKLRELSSSVAALAAYYVGYKLNVRPSSSKLTDMRKAVRQLHTACCRHIHWASGRARGSGGGGGGGGYSGSGSGAPSGPAPAEETAAAAAGEEIEAVVDGEASPGGLAADPSFQFRPHLNLPSSSPSSRLAPPEVEMLAPLNQTLNVARLLRKLGQGARQGPGFESGLGLEEGQGNRHMQAMCAAHVAAVEALMPHISPDALRANPTAYSSIAVGLASAAACGPRAVSRDPALHSLLKRMLEELPYSRLSLALASYEELLRCAAASPYLAARMCVDGLMDVLLRGLQATPFYVPSGDAFGPVVAALSAAAAHILDAQPGSSRGPGTAEAVTAAAAGGAGAAGVPDVAHILTGANGTLHGGTSGAGSSTLPKRSPEKRKEDTKTVADKAHVLGALRERHAELQAAMATAGLQELGQALRRRRTEVLPVARRLAGALLTYWQLVEQQPSAAEVQLELAQVSATRSCAYLCCANLVGEGGPNASQGVGSKKCSACKAVWYCGEACAAANWEAGHKHVCKQLGELRRGGPVPHGDASSHE